MALSASQIFDVIASQYASDSDKDNFLTIARLQTSSSCFGDKYNLAVALRAAHMMTLRDQSVGGGGVGPATTRREGDLSIGYGASFTIGVRGDLGQTSYGVQLDELIKGNIVPFSVVGNTQLNC